MERTVTKIWVQAKGAEERTEARFLNNPDEHLDVYIGVIGPESLMGRFPSTSIEIVSSDHPLADYFEFATMFIISDRLKSVFDEFNVGCEYFQLHVMRDGVELVERKYYFAHILEFIDAFDLENGKYTFWKSPEFADHIKTIKKLRIDESKAHNHDLFRLNKCSPVIFCVSDRLANRIEELKLTGMRFVEPKKWRFGM